MKTGIDLLIAGASARAAAFSAVRGGLRVACADLFADVDLAAVADVTAIADWPGGIEAWARGFPANVPLMYVGGLENEPELLGRIAARRPVYGVRGEALRRVRTPEMLRDLFGEHGLRVPELGTPNDIRHWRSQWHPKNGEPRWLVKPRRGAAGRGIRFWTGTGDETGKDCYLQRFVEGVPGAAAFLAAGGGVELLGATESLLPDERPLADEMRFAYVGSVTTDRFPEAVLRWIGGSLARVGIDGLFGVDFVFTESADGPRVVLLEVNPRYTAGMEVLELRDGRSFLAGHMAAFGRAIGRARTPLTPDPSPEGEGDWNRGRPGAFGGSGLSGAGTNGGRYVGKRVVYAPRVLRTRGLVAPTRLEMLAGDYAVADVPAEGTVVPAGGPVCTVLARAGSVERCRGLLKEAERGVVGRCEVV